MQICANGLRITADAMRSVHLGSVLDEGAITWSADTQRKQLAVITAKAVDAVRTFVSPDYLKAKLADIEAKAGVKLTDAAKTIEVVTQRLKISEDHAKTVLDFFIAGGSLTAGGVLGAVTATAQTIADPDDAADLEALGIEAMELAALVGA